MQRLDFTVTTAAKMPLDVQGNYLRYFKVTAGEVAPGIAFKTNNGDEGILYPGEDVTLAREFDSLLISNFDGVNTISGYLGVAGIGERYSAARIAGTVSVTDGAAAVTKAGQAFIGYAPCGALAGNVSVSQLHNPAGSGKNAFIKRLYPWCSTVLQYALLGLHDTALTACATPKAVNKKSGGAASACDLRYVNAGATPGTRLALIGMPIAFSNVPVSFEHPIQLAPGQGLIVASYAVNVDVNCSFDFYEEPI